MTKSQTNIRKYSGSRSKKENRLGQAHLAAGMNEARLKAIYRGHNINTLDDLAAASDETIDEMLAEVAAIVERTKDAQASNTG
jgi:hypothetical protein